MSPLHPFLKLRKQRGKEEGVKIYYYKPPNQPKPRKNSNSLKETPKVQPPPKMVHDDGIFCFFGGEDVREKFKR